MKAQLASHALSTLVTAVRTWIPGSSRQEEFTYIDISSIQQETKSIEGARMLPCSEAPSRARQLVADGDVLVSTVRPNLNSVAAVPPQLDGATASTGFCVLRPEPSVLYTRFLFHWVKSPRFVDDMTRKATGASYPAISDRIVLDSRMPLPPLAEQRRIAAILDQADTLRTQRREALAHAESLTQSIFLDMFGDSRLTTQTWPLLPLGSIVRNTRLGLVRGSEAIGPGFRHPYVRMNSISRTGELLLSDVLNIDATDAEVEQASLLPGDILFNTRNSRELVGKTGIFRGPGLYLFNNNLMRIRFSSSVHPEYVAAAFQTPFVQAALDTRKSGTTSVFAIYYKDLSSLPLPLPPLPLQQEFARRVEAVEKLKAAHRAHLAHLDELFASLQHRAFRGEL